MPTLPQNLKPELKIILERIEKTIKFTPNPRVKCPICQDELITFDDKGRAVECRCHYERRMKITLQNKLESAAIPSLFQKTSWDLIEPYIGQAEIYTHISQWLKEYHPSKSILLLGESGAGKTMFACALLREIIKKGYDGAFWDSSTLFDSLRQDILSDKPDKYSRWNELLKKEIVVLDDIGKFKVTDWTEERMFIFINQRYNNKTGLIVTSNLSLEKLKENLGYAVVNRLASISECLEFIPSGWEEA